MIGTGALRRLSVSLEGDNELYQCADAQKYIKLKGENMKKTNKIVALVVSLAMIMSVMSVLPIVSSAESWVAPNFVGCLYGAYGNPTNIYNPGSNWTQSANQGTSSYYPFAVYNDGITGDTIRVHKGDPSLCNTTGNAYSAAKIYVGGTAWGNSGTNSVSNLTEVTVASFSENDEWITYTFAATTGKTFLVAWGTDEGGHTAYGPDYVQVSAAASSRPIDFASAGGVWQSSIDASTYGAAALDVDPGQQYIAGYEGVIDSTIYNLGEGGDNYCLKGGYVWYTFNAPKAGTYTFAFKANTKTGTPRAFNFGIDCDPDDASTQYQAMSDENFRGEAWAVIDIDLAAGDHTLYVLTATDFDGYNGQTPTINSVEIKHVAIYSPVPADTWYRPNFVGCFYGTPAQSLYSPNDGWTQECIQATGCEYFPYATYNDGLTRSKSKNMWMQPAILSVQLRFTLATRYGAAAEVQVSILLRKFLPRLQRLTDGLFTRLQAKSLLKRSLWHGAAM